MAYLTWQIQKTKLSLLHPLNSLNIHSFLFLPSLSEINQTWVSWKTTNQKQNKQSQLVPPPTTNYNTLDCSMLKNKWARSPTAASWNAKAKATYPSIGYILLVDSGCSFWFCILKLYTLQETHKKKWALQWKIKTPHQH